MDKATAQNISSVALTIEEYAEIPEKLRKIAEFIVEPLHKKELKEIASFLERAVPDELFHSPKLGAYLLYQLLSSSDRYQSYEQLGTKIGRSPSTTQQTINALKNGGISMEETPAKGYKINPLGGRPRKKRVIY